MNRREIPGVVVLVVSRDRVLYHEAFGKMDVAHGLSMQKDAIVRIASITKPLTSTAVMMLVEEGKLRLDDEVATYLPAFTHPQVIQRVDVAAGTYETRPATHPITIRQLLTHTSGIGYSWSDPGLALIEKLTGRTSEVDLPLVHNTFFWIDPQAGIGCVVLMQFLPFYDEAALNVVNGVESRVYEHLRP